LALVLVMALVLALELELALVMVMVMALLPVADWVVLFQQVLWFDLPEELKSFLKLGQ